MPPAIREGFARMAFHTIPLKSSAPPTMAEPAHDQLVYGQFYLLAGRIPRFLDVVWPLVTTKAQRDQRAGIRRARGFCR